MNRTLGYLSSLAWCALAIVTALGILQGQSGLILINLVMSAAFACCAAFLTWRTWTVEGMRRRHGGSPEVKRLLVSDAISATAVLLIGTFCLAAAIYRVWFEHVPVFG